jgi:putative toxin-antitoxin system antitoxin component (TIGR02293 family)
VNRLAFGVWRLAGTGCIRKKRFSVRPGELNPARGYVPLADPPTHHLSCKYQTFVYNVWMRISFERQIQKALDDPALMRAAVKEGFEIGWFDHLAKLFGASGTVFATIVGIESRTLTRRRREGKLTQRESNALYHLAVLYEHALDVLGDAETVRNWFNTPEPDFADVSPLALLDTAPGIKEVDQLLGRIEHGVF